MMTIMYPYYENYKQYAKYDHDHDQNDWGFFVNLDDLYDHQQLSHTPSTMLRMSTEYNRKTSACKQASVFLQNNKYIDNYKKQQKRINYMSSIREVDRNVEIDIIDDEEFGWYVPDKLPNKPQNKFEQRDMNMQMQRDMDIRETDKRTKININIEYDYDDKNEVMKSCLNTCIVLGISIGCSIFIVLF